MSFGGIVKDYRKKLVLDDVEDGDLLYEDVEDEKIWNKIKTHTYQFKNGEYGLQYYEIDL